jgi:predicted transcriptional regulator
MRLWDLDTSAAHLRDATEELQIAWQQVSEYWSDSVSEGYCEKHLEQIGPAVKKSLEAGAQMQQLLNQIYLDCES